MSKILTDEDFMKSEDWGSWSDFLGDLEDTSTPYKLIEQYGGEGRGEEAWVVFEEVSSGQLYRIDGWYASYDGFTWDGGVYPVVPKQKTITVYE